ncbi:MAG: PfkB family carbohydrate kinase [Candidatus Neomarinimicrobiota bacterium]
MNPKPVLIVGSIALDTIETPAGRRADLIGGSTTYALIAAGRTAPVQVVGVVGSDFPETGLALYRQYASDLTDLVVAEGPTFRWGGRYHANGDDRTTLFTELGVFGSFNPRLSAVNRQVPLVFLANIHPTLQLTVIEQSAADALIVTDTMNLWIDTTPDELSRVLRRTDVLLINETEAQALANEADLDRAGRALLTFGPQTVVVKQGSRGASLFTDQRRVDIGIYPVPRVVDPTGAGDTFGGGFMAALAGGAGYTEAIIDGSALASFCVEGFGIEALLAAAPEQIERRKTWLRRTVNS